MVRLSVGNKEDDRRRRWRGQKAARRYKERFCPDNPNVKWEDVAGLEGAKEALKRLLYYRSNSRICSLARGSRGRVYCSMDRLGRVSPIWPKRWLRKRTVRFSVLVVVIWFRSGWVRVRGRLYSSTPNVCEEELICGVQTCQAILQYGPRKQTLYHLHRRGRCPMRTPWRRRIRSLSAYQNRTSRPNGRCRRIQKAF